MFKNHLGSQGFAGSDKGCDKRISLYYRGMIQSHKENGEENVDLSSFANEFTL